MSVPFEVDDLFRFRCVRELHAVPGNACAAAAVRGVDRSSDRYRSAIWIVPLDGGAPWQLTSGNALDAHPRWAGASSTLAFVSDRDGKTQIYSIDTRGGEARKLTSFVDGVTAFAWSPDAKRLLVIATVRVDPEKRGAPGDPPPPDSDRPHVVWRLPYKSDAMGYLLDRESHLFVFDVETHESRQLTHGPIEVRSAEWSPDGRRIAYARTRSGRFAHRTDVWVMDDDGSNARQLSQNVATTSYPKWSPDGRRIAFAGSAIEGDAQMRPWVVDVESRNVRAVGDESLEVVSGQTMFWSADGAKLLLVLARRGRQELVEVRIADGHVRRLVTGERHVVQFAPADRQLVFSTASLGAPSDVYVAANDGSGERRLTDLNAWCRERSSIRVEARRFDVPDGDGGTEQIDGWLLLPDDAEDRDRPLLVDVHGGPHSYVDFEYDRHVYWPVLLSRGWAILALNAVGSSSYGPSFARRLRGRWGELDLPQHVAAIDALAKEGTVGKRIAITGKSYGGYLSAWAIGHTDRFSAAVVAAPVSNLHSHYGTSDSGYYVTPYAIDANPEEARETEIRLSPVSHAARATTPTLILQGAADERCPVGQAEELYVAMMRNEEATVELVIYPGGTHHLAEQGKPSMRCDYYNRLVDWLQRFAGTR